MVTDNQAGVMIAKTSMIKQDKRVDRYIAESPDFARPILEHLRRVVHAASPEIEETIKWQKPTFVYKGIVCSLAAFKAHCALGFWKHALIFGVGSARKEVSDEAMGQFGRLAAVSDLPPEPVLIGYVQKAVRLNEQGIKLPQTAKPAVRRQLAIPTELSVAFKKNQKALETFEGFSSSHKREYLEWIAEAKREETRLKRLEQTITLLAQGKARYWKYTNC